MNIQFQVAASVILVLIFYMYKRHPIIKSRQTQAFRAILACSMITLATDIISVVCIYYKDVVSEDMAIIANRAYIIMLVCMSFMAYYYVLVGVTKKIKVEKRVWLFRACFVIACISIVALPISVVDDGKSQYATGPGIMATYAWALFYILAALVIVVVDWKHIVAKRRNAVVTWMIIWVIAATIQFFNPPILLVGMACALGVLLLFADIENPETDLDPATEFFNFHALTEYAGSRIAYEEPMSVIVISLEPENLHHISSTQVDEFMPQVISFLKSLPKDVLVFKNIRREFVIVLEKQEGVIDLYHDIAARFDHGFELAEIGSTVRVEPLIIVMPSVKAIADGAEFIETIEYYENNYREYARGEALILNEELLNRKREADLIENLIIDAIQNDRVEVFYQPIYSLKEKKFISAEALVRILKSDGSLIPPGVFIPVAEVTGSMEKLGEIIFEKVCRFAEVEKPEQYGIEFIEVNLSVTQAENVMLAETYKNIIRRFKVDPSFINLEITETTQISNRHNLLKNMDQLIESGMHFSIDDFGSGQSNLNYMIDLPVRIIKLDMSLVKNYFVNEKAQFVIKSTISMAHDIGLSVVAEGVETVEELSAMESLGIDYIQGYFFSKPIPAKDFVKFLEVHSR